MPGLPRAAQLDEQDRPQDAGLQGSVGKDLRLDRHPREVPGAAQAHGRARVGAHEGQRLAGMPQLPFGPIDGPDQAEPARGCGARAVHVYGREDLHRLPQRHRAQTAEHVRRSGMAVMMRRSSFALWAALALGSMVPGHPERALAQAAGAPAPVQSVDAARFLSLAHSFNAMQARASELVASRDTRPEARSLATAMLEFRRALGAKLDGLARERNLTLPTALEFEHQTILENLEPLDALELSRRYAEVEVQALPQELQLYRTAQASDESLRALANDTAPKIQQLLYGLRLIRPGCLAW